MLQEDKINPYTTRGKKGPWLLDLIEIRISTFSFLVVRRPPQIFAESGIFFVRCVQPVKTRGGGEQ